tara:strand:+ start:3589 stop:4623 length:1035 start_codon:yes stop_codon:yes gene_type:complete
MNFEVVETATGQMAMKFECEAIPPLKDNIYTMEHPFFSLTKRKDTKIRQYEHNGVEVEIAPGAHGMPTMFDKDMLVYCISHVKQKIERGEKTSRVVRFIVRQYLSTTKRGVGGNKYKSVESGLERLSGVRVKTTIKTNGVRIKEGFGLIDGYRIIEKSELDDRMIALEIPLSKWVFNAIEANEILTLSPDYFNISKPLKKRIYELARKHCGNQSQFPMLLVTLHKKSGSTSPLKQFRHQVKEIEKENDLPDYKLMYLEEKDKVIFVPRQGKIKKITKTPYQGSKQTLKPATHENVRKMFIKRDGRCSFDVYALYDEWVHWWEKQGCPKLDNPDGAFYKFCQQKK